MGEVYRARDTKLNRDVAIKVLPDLVTNDAERLARFTREAQILASLNHPNIAHIYGLEESDRVRALVMELVAGEDLSQRIMRGAIPLDEAVPIAKQIAEALEAAHAQGIIHRDLKPANIKLRGDGTVKVLDFGLAKAVVGNSSAPDLSHSPTVTLGTQVGVILGTAAYMSPEQARGQSVDRRTDIWAYGCVLYEMLTGRAAFARAQSPTRSRRSSNGSHRGIGCLTQLPHTSAICCDAASRKIKGIGCTISLMRGSSLMTRLLLPPAPQRKQHRKPNERLAYAERWRWSLSPGWQVWPDGSRGGHRARPRIRSPMRNSRASRISREPSTTRPFPQMASSFPLCQTETGSLMSGSVRSARADSPMSRRASFRT